MDGDGETETVRKWPLTFEQPGPAVRIHLAPPPSLVVAAISGEQREMAAFVARFEHPTEPEGRISESFDAVRVFLSAQAQVGSVSQLLRLTPRGSWLPMSRT